ncbi:hypothetical protein EBS80_00040 [bacterium]|nr:hypothetical protein [bacterium]
MANPWEQPSVERPTEGKPEAPKHASEAVRRAQEAAVLAARERAEAAVSERVDARMALQGVITSKDMSEYRAAAVALQPHLDALTRPERMALLAKSDAMSMGPAVMGSVAELTAVNVIAERVREWKREAAVADSAEPPSVVARFLRKGLGRR